MALKFDIKPSPRALKTRDRMPQTFYVAVSGHPDGPGYLWSDGEVKSSLRRTTGDWPGLYSTREAAEAAVADMEMWT